MRGVLTLIHEDNYLMFCDLEGTDDRTALIIQYGKTRFSIDITDLINQKSPTKEAIKQITRQAIEMHRRGYSIDEIMEKLRGEIP